MVFEDVYSISLTSTMPHTFLFWCMTMPGGARSRKRRFKVKTGSQYQPKLFINGSKQNCSEKSKAECFIAIIYQEHHSQVGVQDTSYYSSTYINSSKGIFRAHSATSLVKNTNNDVYQSFHLFSLLPLGSCLPDLCSKFRERHLFLRYCQGTL